MVYANFSSNLPTGLQHFEFVDLTILFVNSLYLNGKYVIVLKISADDNQGHEDSKWLFVMYFRCTSFFDISNPKRVRVCWEWP